MASETLVLQVNNNSNAQKIQTSEEVVFKRPSNPGEIPRSTGVNIIELTKVKDVQYMKEKLREMGIEIKYIIFNRTMEGNQLVFLYCVTIYGQYVLVESPPNIKCDIGNLEIAKQRVGILQSNIVDYFREQLEGIYTGHAFICSGGIHYVKYKTQETIIYDYDNFKTAKRLFELKKHHFIVIPSVPFVNLVEANRLNTIEAYINVIDVEGIAKDLISKSGLISLLTMKGPFTFFLPKKDKLKSLASLDNNKIRAVLLAHIVIGKTDSGNEFTAIAQNKINVARNDKGEIQNVTSGNRSSKVFNKTNKYNGTIYMVDSLFTPIQETFKIPEKSDLDDVVTIFDISRSTMEIRKVEYELNLKNQEQILTLLQYIAQTSRKLYDGINQNSLNLGQQLLKDSNDLMEFFYTREVPCTEKCEKLEELTKKVKTENLDFETLIRASNSLGSLKVTTEKLYQKLLRIEQRLTVKNPIVGGTNYIEEEDEDD